jgi:SAM-dependent methyltransferase
LPQGDGVVFDAGAGNWIGVLGRLRDVVRQEVLRTQIASLPHPAGLPAGRPLRVLDVGCGQGTQALHLARAGHQVTGLDSSAELLGRFAAALASEPAGVVGRVDLIEGVGERAPELAAGPFDLVLCHGVLMYLADIAPMLRALSLVAAPDGTISLLVRNGLAMAMRDGLRGDWAAALAAFDSKDYVNRLGLPARAHRPRTSTRSWHRSAGGAAPGSGYGSSPITGTSRPRSPSSWHRCSQPSGKRAPVTLTGVWPR